MGGDPRADPGEAISLGHVVKTEAAAMRAGLRLEVETVGLAVLWSLRLSKEAQQQQSCSQTQRKLN